MRIAPFAVAAVLTASLTLSRVDAETTEAKAGPTSYLVVVDGASVAILPDNLKCTISVSCSGDATYDKSTETAVFTKDVKLVASVSNHAAITITGDSVTLLPQR